MNPNYGEIICESVKIINESLLAGLQYDQTVKCTVIDDSKAAQGEYRVSNGSAAFIAYSTDKFSNGTNVYVTVPKGDYSNDKLIVGKVASTTQEPFNYIAPFDNFLDITDNLVAAADFETATGLLANDDRTPKDQHLYKKLFSITGDKLGSKGLEGFTRLGIKASFRTFLQEQFDCVAGNYGLWLEVTFRGSNTVANEDNGGTYTKNLYFDTTDMIGNPYAFESYFSQEKLFDIENLGSIININVYFYQDLNSFITAYKALVPCKDNELEDFEDNYLFDNLFVKNIHIAAGFDISNKNEEFIQLYTLDALTYTSKADDAINKKEILLRWMHQIESGKKVMNESVSDIFEIRWYQYKLGAAAPDEYAGVNWQLINLELDGTCGRRFKATLQPDTTLAQEQIKVIILYGEAPGYYKYEVNPFNDKEQFLEKYRDYYVALLDEDTGNIISYRQCIEEDWSENNLIDYYYKIDNRVVYRSDSIIFTNEVDVPSKATMEALSSLTLECYDLIDSEWIPTYGNYLLYNEQNDLIDKSQANVQRLIKWTLNLEDFKTENVSEVQWEVPDGNTMLKKIERYNEKDNISEGLTYYIGNHYSISNTNNTINCKVVHNGVIYSASQELTFGPAGTMGASATFVLDFVKDQQAISLPFIHEDGQVEYDSLDVKAILYDENNKLISDEVLSQYTIIWDWYCSPEVLSDEGGDLYTNYIAINQEQHPNVTENPITGIQVTLDALRDLNLNSCYILRATLKGWQNTDSNTAYDLIAYLPIPLRKNYDYTHQTGTDEVIYLSDGTPEYYKNYYILHHLDGTKYYDKWQLKSFFSREFFEEKDTNGNVISSGYRDLTEDSIYYPEISSSVDNTKGIIWKFKPSPLHYDGMTTFFAAQCIIDNDIKWVQPILIIQSRYFSSMINKWDGKTIHFEKEDGDILASRIGAGRKNADNQFSGVLLGDWEKKVASGTIKNTGLYGFNNGLLTFGFKDDGTAFIGPKDKGQLQFDGHKSTITSASYRDGNSSGMVLDFDAPYIKMRQYFSDTAYIVKGASEITYIPYGDTPIDDAATWANIGRSDLYVLINDSYQRVYTWNDAYAGQTFYEQKITQKEYPPFKGLKTAAEFNAKLKEYGVTQFKVYLNSKWSLVNQWDENEFNTSTIFYHPNIDTTQPAENRSINIDATDITYPLKIGNKFRVRWDGTIEASDGQFSGRITGSTISGSSVTTTYLSANNGYIGGWTISSNSITSQDNSMYLNSYTNVINGGTIQGSTLRSPSGTMMLDGYLQVQGGTGRFGSLQSDTTEANIDRTGIGMFYGGSAVSNTEATSEIKVTAANCGIKYQKNYISCGASGIAINANNTGAFTKINGQLQLYNSKVILGTALYGTKDQLPATGTVGQIFFQIVG